MNCAGQPSVILDHHGDGPHIRIRQSDGSMCNSFSKIWGWSRGCLLFILTTQFWGKISLHSMGDGRPPGWNQQPSDHWSNCSPATAHKQCCLTTRLTLYSCKMGAQKLHKLLEKQTACSRLQRSRFLALVVGLACDAGAEFARNERFGPPTEGGIRITLQHDSFWLKQSL